MPPACAQCPPNGQFLDSRAGADKKKVDQVHRPDQQQYQYGRLQEQQGGADSSDMIGVKRHDDGTKTGHGHLFGLRIILLQGGILSVDLRLRLRQRRARLEPRNHLDDISSRMPLPRCALLRVRGKRKIQLRCRREEAKIGGQDADYSPWNAVDRGFGVPPHAGRPGNASASRRP